VALAVRTYGYGQNVGDDAFDVLHQLLLEAAPDPARAPKLIALRDKIADRDMPALYAACDAFVLPSRGEGWGIPYMEAMASALPWMSRPCGHSNAPWMPRPSVCRYYVNGAATALRLQSPPPASSGSRLFSIRVVTLMRPGTWCSASTVSV